jgi:hypothetical protein
VQVAGDDAALMPAVSKFGKYDDSNFTLLPLPHHSLPLPHHSAAVASQPFVALGSPTETPAPRSLATSASVPVLAACAPLEPNTGGEGGRRVLTPPRPPAALGVPIPVGEPTESRGKGGLKAQRLTDARARGAKVKPFKVGGMKAWDVLQ